MTREINKRIAVGSISWAFIAAFAMGGANAAPLTGEELDESSSFDAPSTNQLNFDKQVPGREGQTAPYVLFEGAGLGYVTLGFHNESAAPVAFFEYRIDGQTVGSDPHLVVPDDVIHPGVGVGTFYDSTYESMTFNAGETVEVRLALGGERDWDFDWTSFPVEGAATVPAPGALGLLGVGLLGFAMVRRRRA